MVHFARNPSLFSVLLGNGDGDAAAEDGLSHARGLQPYHPRRLERRRKPSKPWWDQQLRGHGVSGTGGGNFGLPAHYSMSQAYMTLWRYLNGDGHFDLVTSTIGGGSCPPRPSRCASGTPTERSETRRPMRPRNGPQQPRIASTMTEDGKPDVALGSFGECPSCLGMGTEGWARRTTIYAGTDPSNLMIGDLNEDRSSRCRHERIRRLAVLLPNRGAPLGTHVVDPDIRSTTFRAPTGWRSVISTGTGTSTP